MVIWVYTRWLTTNSMTNKATEGSVFDSDSTLEWASAWYTAILMMVILKIGEYVAAPLTPKQIELMDSIWTMFGFLVVLLLLLNMVIPLIAFAASKFYH